MALRHKTESSRAQSKIEGDPKAQSLRCVTLMDDIPGSQYESIRRPLPGIRGWIARSEDKLLHKLRPELQTSGLVRGNRIATDALFRALIEHSQRLEVVLAVPDHDRSKFVQWGKRTFQNLAERPIEAFGRGMLNREGLDAAGAECLLSLHGRTDELIRMRNGASARIVPTVTVMHGFSNHNYLYDHFLRMLLTPHYACDALVCTSVASKTAMETLLANVSHSFNQEFGTSLQFKGRIDVIPLCVDADPMSENRSVNPRRELGLAGDAVVLLYFGYLSGVKADLGPLLLVIHKLINETANSKLMFVIAGTGPESYYVALSQLIDQLGLAKHVRFFRDPSDEKKSQLFVAADVFVAPCDSLQESFGLTPVEAMAFGVPQLVADWSGYRDTVVEGETGFLVPTVWGRCDSDLRMTGEIFGWRFDHIVQGQSISFDLHIMYERLRTLIERPDLRRKMSDNSRARAKNEYNANRIAGLYDDLAVELASTAQSIHRNARLKKAYDEPAYFDCFKADASHLLTEHSLISKGTYSPLPVSSALHMLQAMIPDVPVIDQSLLTRLLEKVGSGGDCKEVAVKTLVAGVAEFTNSADVVTRHILFLIKHGFLRVHNPAAHAT